jgi:hypothetical protein
MVSTAKISWSMSFREIVFDIDSVLGDLHRVLVSHVPDVSEALAPSIFRAEGGESMYLRNA